MKKYVLTMLCVQAVFLNGEEPFGSLKVEKKESASKHPFEKRAEKFGQNVRKGPCHTGIPTKDIPPLLKAVKEGNLEVVKSEFKKKMGEIPGWREGDLHTHTGKRSCTFHDSEGRSLLHWAAFYGHLDIVQFLIQQDAEVNQADNGGWTPLHYAVVEGHDKVVSYLRSRGADLNACTKQDARVWILATDRAVQNVLEGK
jgi:hypothetical protein